MNCKNCKTPLPSGYTVPITSYPGVMRIRKCKNCGQVLQSKKADPRERKSRQETLGL